MAVVGGAAGVQQLAGGLADRDPQCWVGVFERVGGRLGFDTEACDTAVLLASETVTNAFTHGHSDARVRVSALPGVLLVEVADDNSRHPERRAQDPDALDGRGLSIIEMLAARWGVRDDAFGKTVWFEVRNPG